MQEKALETGAGPKHNYQRDLDYIIRRLERTGEVPTLLLHACCAPCSSYTIEYLSQYFKITLFYYNPNIAPDEEYRHRVEEIKRFVKEFKTKHPVTLIEGEYDPKKFYDAVRGLEKEPEGGKRCRKCFELRLAEAARLAQKLNADYFTTTLTISPMKDAQVLNEVVQEQCDIYGIKRLPSDFKKRGGVQAFHRTFRRIPSLPPELLRLRVFQAGKRRGITVTLPLLPCHCAGTYP